MDKLTFQCYLESGSIGVISLYYPLVSFTEKSEPSAGSECRPSNKLKADFFLNSQLRKLVHKHNGDFVAYYDGATVRFWKDN